MIANVFIYGTLMCVAGQLDVPQSPSFRASSPSYAPVPVIAPPPARHSTGQTPSNPFPPDTYGTGELNRAGGSFPPSSGEPASWVPPSVAASSVAASSVAASSVAASSVATPSVAAPSSVPASSAAGGTYAVSPAGFSESGGQQQSSTKGFAPRNQSGQPTPSQSSSSSRSMDAAAPLPAILASKSATLKPESIVAVTPGSLVAAIDDMTNFSDPATWWRNLLRLVRQRGSELAINLLSAVTILIVGRWFARVSSKLLGRLAARAKCDTTLAKFASHLSYAAILALVVLSALHRIGIDTTSFTAVVAAAGLAVGLALQGSLANFAAGVLLIVFKPFKVGDSVLAGGSTGTIEEIQIFNTLIRTDNNAVVIVPNGSITAATITNYSAESTRRIDITLRCSYDNNLLELKRFLLELLAADDRVLQLPPPVVAIDQLADTGMHVVVQPWVRTEYLPAVRADLLEAIKVGFERHGFRMVGQVKPPLAIRRVAA